MIRVLFKVTKFQAKSNESMQKILQIESILISWLVAGKKWELWVQSVLDAKKLG
jgi:hypothetical protein